MANNIKDDVRYSPLLPHSLRRILFLFDAGIKLPDRYVLLFTHDDDVVSTTVVAYTYAFGAIHHTVASDI
jgi:hypothetical protein